MAEATLSPYNPTWRDRIASALAGDSRPGSSRSNFAEGLMGSRGIGTTGMGLADLTPAGIPMAAQDAQRSARAGDPVGAITNAMAVIPAAKMPIRAGQQAIKAYHGSPHSFDSFDLSKAGSTTDPGLLGKGLYFTTDKEAVASYPQRYEASLNIANPLVLSPESWKFSKPAMVSDALGISPPNGKAGLKEWSNLASSELAKKGHDAVVLDYSNIGYPHKEVSVLDDKLIDIVRKYGLGGLMMGGLGASALSGSQGAQPPQPPQM